MTIINVVQLRHVMQCPMARAQRWIDPLNAAMRRFGINTRRRAAYFLAQIGHESLSLARQEERLSFSQKRLEEAFGQYLSPEELPGFVRQPERLGNRVYANRHGNGNEASGDGYHFRARGAMALCGRANYRHIGQLIDQPLEEMPRLLLAPEISAMAAAAYWRHIGLNALADRGYVLEVSRKLNLGSTATRATPAGFMDRRHRTLRAMTVLAAR